MNSLPGRDRLVFRHGIGAAAGLGRPGQSRYSIIFLDTGHHFPETLAYRDVVQRRLGLTDVRTVTPRDQDRGARDPDATLWQFDTDACCSLRKVEAGCGTQSPNSTR